MVDRRHRLVERDRQVLVERDDALHGLFGERLQQILRTVRLGLLGRPDRLIEQASLLRLCRFCRLGLAFGVCRGHYSVSFCSPPDEASTPSAFDSSSMSSLL